MSSVSVKYIQYSFDIGNQSVSEISLNNQIVRSEETISYICDPFVAIDAYGGVPLVIRLPTPNPNNNNKYISLDAYEKRLDGLYVYRADIAAGQINYQDGHILINKIFKEDSLAIKFKSFNKDISPLLAIASKFKLILQ